MTLPAPHLTAYSLAARQYVKPEWIDHNDHMNVAFYLSVFDLGVDHLYEELGIGPDFVKERQRSTFTAQVSIWYRREVKLNDPLDVYIRLLDHDHKRLHLWLEMYHGDEGYLAAESEQVGIHVDLETRKSCPFSDEIAANVKRIATAHQGPPPPPASGQGVGLIK